MQQISGFYSKLAVCSIILFSYITSATGLLCHCDPCQGKDKENATCEALEGRRCFAAYTKDNRRERRFYGCTRSRYAVSKCEDDGNPTSFMTCCDDMDLCNLLLRPTLPPTTVPPVIERPESKTIQVMRIVAIVSGPICVLYTLIMVVVCVTRIQRKRRDEQLRRIYGYTPRDHELLPTSTQLLRQQAAAQESSNSADSGIGGEESRSPIYTPPVEHHQAPPAHHPHTHQHLLGETHTTAETHQL